MRLATSCEGYFQCLCEHGHLNYFDLYEDDEAVCSCGAKIAWQHFVDQTNGIDESDQ